MKEYMLIYKGGDPDWKANTTEADRAAAMEQWGAWMETLAKNEQLVTGGSPLEYSGKEVNGAGLVTDIAASELKELVSGYSIVSAANIDEAVKIAKSCPIFNYPDIKVEVRQIMQMG